MNAAVYLAPMAGVTDAAMRDVCILCGAHMTCTEMVSAKGLSYQNKKTNELLQLGEFERQVIVQLFGSDPATLADTAQSVQDMLQGRLFGIDLNMGCPAPKIVRNGDGCALMRDPARAGQIIAAVKHAVTVPVSVKFRSGFSENEKNAVAFAKIAEQSGADTLTVHGRTREQQYSGKADWNMIRDVKSAVRIPVFGSGDIFHAQDALAMLKATGCDGVMVARGARGNPFLFTQINELLQTGEIITVPTAADRAEMCLRQARLSIKNKGEKLAMLQMRSHAAHYIKGLKNASRIREAVLRIKTYGELEDLLAGCLLSGK